MRKVLIPKSDTILELFSLIVFIQFCNSIFIIRIISRRIISKKNWKDKEKREKNLSHAPF